MKKIILAATALTLSLTLQAQTKPRRSVTATSTQIVQVNQATLSSTRSNVPDPIGKGRTPRGQQAGQPQQRQQQRINSTTVPATDRVQ